MDTGPAKPDTSGVSRMNQLDIRLLTLAAFLGGCATAAPRTRPPRLKLPSRLLPRRPGLPAAGSFPHAHHARRCARGPLLLAPGQEQPRGDRLPGGGKPLHRRDDGAHQGAPGKALPGNAGPHQANRSFRRHRHGPYYYYTRTVEGQQYTDLRTQAGAWTRPSRCCSIRTRWPRGTSTFAFTP